MLCQIVYFFLMTFDDNKWIDVPFFFSFSFCFSCVSALSIVFSLSCARSVLTTQQICRETRETRCFTTRNSLRAVDSIFVRRAGTTGRASCAHHFPICYFSRRGKGSSGTFLTVAVDTETRVREKTTFPY